MIQTDAIVVPALAQGLGMFALLRFFLALFSSLFKSKSRIEAENAVLRRQLIVLQRKVRGRVHFANSDRLFLIQLYRWFPSVVPTVNSKC